MVANTAGQTKKTAIMSLYRAGSAAGNIVGKYEHCRQGRGVTATQLRSLANSLQAVDPLLFNAKDAPYYVPGIRGCLGIFSAQIATE
jgi:hypothetical protein